MIISSLKEIIKHHNESVRNLNNVNIANLPDYEPILHFNKKRIRATVIL